MSDLVAFLRAHLDEDEQTARAAHGPNWNAEKRDVAYGDEWVVSAMTRADAAHIARHDPARVLREVEAKRRMLEPHGPSDRLEYGEPLCTGCTDLHPCDTLRLLALPYADHPDCREEWKP